VGAGPSPAPAGRVSGARRSARPGVSACPPARRVCSSRGGGGASDSRALPEDFGRNVRRKTPRPSRPSAICSRWTPESVLRANPPSEAGAHRDISTSVACVRTSRRGDSTSDSKMLPEYSRDQHAMERDAHTPWLCVIRTVRNGARLRRSSLDKVGRDNPPPTMPCLLRILTL
jgi:hypothetical protein